MKVSVVSTLYRSAPYLEEFYNRLKASLKKLALEHEFVFVNDGSPDDSLQIVIGISKIDNSVKVIDLSRNFGHHKAIMTGLRNVTGDLVFLIDCDLEEDPENLHYFISEFKKYDSSVDVIYGVQEKREGGFFRRLAGRAFYSLYNISTGTKIPSNISMTRLMTRRYVDWLVMHNDKNVFLAGLFELTGFRQEPLFVRKRFKGKTTYNIKRRIAMALNGVTSFSSRPLELLCCFGLFITSASIMLMVYLVIRKVFFGITIDGWTSLMVSIWFLGGNIVLAVGIVGLYVGKVFVESKERPYTVVRNVYIGGKGESDTKNGRVQIPKDI